MSVKREDKTMETPSLNDAYTLSEGVDTFLFFFSNVAIRRREYINSFQRGRLVGKRRKRKTKNKKTILGIKRRQNLFKIVALGIHVMMKRESNFYKYLNMSKIKYKLDDVVDVKLNKA